MLATKNAFKILFFPDQRLFQCSNPKDKRQWIEAVEETKKSYLALKAAQQNPEIKEMTVNDKDRIEAAKPTENPFGDNDSDTEQETTT